eukprot:5091054-Pyramimonas_sp.AAC.1
MRPPLAGEVEQHAEKFMHSVKQLENYLIAFKAGGESALDDKRFCEEGGPEPSLREIQQYCSAAQVLPVLRTRGLWRDVPHLGFTSRYAPRRPHEGSLSLAKCADRAAGIVQRHHLDALSPTYRQPNAYAAGLLDTLVTTHRTCIDASHLSGLAVALIGQRSQQAD